MKKYIVDFIESNYLCLTQLYICAVAGVIFFSGIGRYRSFLVLFLYFAIYTILLIKKENTSSLKKIYAPVLVISVYFDVNNGPILPLFKFNNLAASFVIYFGLKWLLDSVYKKNIEKLVHYNIFTCCPKCNFEANQFTINCVKCGYFSQNNNDIAVTLQHALPLSVTEVTKKRVNLGMFSGASIYKNQYRLECSDCIITNERVILVTKQFCKRGVANKSEILLSSIANVHTEKRKHHGLDMNIITFTENDNFYELFQIHKRTLEDLTEIIKLLTDNPTIR